MKKYGLPLLLFFIGLGILIFPHAAQRVNKEIHAQQVEKIQREIQTMPVEKKEKIMEEVRSCNEAISRNEDEVNDPFTDHYHPGHYKACEKIVNKSESEDNEYPIALEVPQLDLNIPIFLGASQENLAKGISQVEGSSLPFGGEGTHTVLAGHRGMGTKAMFRHIDELSPGDIFYIHTVEETLTYKVYDTRIILPHEVESLYIQEEKDLASLFSCHPYPHNSHRLVVYGERIHD